MHRGQSFIRASVRFCMFPQQGFLSTKTCTVGTIHSLECDDGGSILLYEKKSFERHFQEDMLSLILC